MNDSFKKKLNEIKSQNKKNKKNKKTLKDILAEMGYKNLEDALAKKNRWT